MLRSVTWVWLNKIWDFPSACLGNYGSGGVDRETLHFLVNPPTRCATIFAALCSAHPLHLHNHMYIHPSFIIIYLTMYCDDVVLTRLYGFHLRSDLLVALPDGEPAPRALHRPPVAPHHHQRRLHHVQDVLCKQSKIFKSLRQNKNAEMT